MKTLILLSNFFPYGNGEPYLETEVKYYSQYFERIYIASLQLRKKDLQTIRSLPSEKIKVLAIRKAANWIYFLNSIRVLLDKNLYREIWKLLHNNKLSINRIISLFVYLSRSYYEAHKIKKWLKREKVMEGPNNKGVIYSYRFEYQPYVALLIKKRIADFKVVARGHRFDLYEERRKNNYIPLREFLLDKLDETILISQDGVDYLMKKFPEYKHKIKLSRLGVSDNGLGQVERRSLGIQIVSCSTIIEVKRIDLIVRALAEVNNIIVYWDHYGEGRLYTEIKALASSILPQNIKYHFYGYVDNEKLLNVYRNKSYHLFLNVSSSEGIPVSIMEAMSFGIPCIATDVGGTSEILENQYNGMMLPCDFKPVELAKKIKEFAKMSEIDYHQFRENARSTWKEKYSAERNYTDFLKHLCQ